MTLDAAPLLPPQLIADLERKTGAKIIGVTPRGGGGASRSGAELLLDRDGETQRAYLAYRKEAGRDHDGSGLGSHEAFRRETSILRALSRELSAAGVRAPRLLAAQDDHRALLTEFSPGEPNFRTLTTEEERRAVGFDFMAQMAKLHAIDIHTVDLDGFHPLEPPSALVRKRIAQVRATKLAMTPDPLIQLAMDWLEDNVPEGPIRVAILHGDAGPANFLFQDGRVTAMLDWELASHGDPMADLAMLCIRNLFQPFVSLKDAFAAYEAAGGQPVDLDRVRYYRLYFQGQFASPPEALLNPDTPRPTAFGTNLVYATLHMRILSEALAEAAGVDLPAISLPELVKGPHDRSFELALDDLKDVIVPRISDQEASAKAKSLARLVKWWRDLERWGPACDALERAETGAALGRDFATAGEARAALLAAIADKAVDIPTAIRLCHARATRNALIFADGLGGLADTRFAPLDA